MLFAGWEVRIVKNCDLGLEKCCPRPPRPSWQITFFSAIKLAYKWVYATLSLNWLTCRLRTIVKNLTCKRASNLDTQARQRKMY